MKLTDSVATARAEYAAAVSPVLGRDPADVLAVMDRELAQLRSHVDSVSDRRWYLSLAKGAPDYGIYDDPDYMLYLWPGTVLFARPTLRWIVSQVSAGQVDTVIDLGCGIGYSTACLANAYPDAAVFGTNVEGVQAEVGRMLGKEHGFTLVPDVSAVPCDDLGRTLVVASEYFEHFHRPVEHLIDVLTALGDAPRWMAIANAFGARSAGHFPEYVDRSRRFSSRAIGIQFNGMLRRYRYARAGSGWNGRPTLWESSSAFRA